MPPRCRRRRRPAVRSRCAGRLLASFYRCEFMELRSNQLAAHLERTLAPVYVIHGDEPLQAIEAGDAIRAAARRAGFDEREMLVVEPGFKWDAFLAAGANMGLFGARRLVDLAIPSGKPGVEGAKALELFASRVGPDQMLLVTLPKIDRAAQSSAWFTALADAGVAIAVYPLERDALPQWIAARLARARQRVAPETLAFLADRCEGNLLAAHQEIEKLVAPAAGRRARRRGCRARGDRRRALRRLPALGSVARGRARARAPHHRRARSRGRRHPAPAVAVRAKTSTRWRRCRRPWRPEHRCPPPCATRVSGASGRRRWSAPHGACRQRSSRR